MYIFQGYYDTIQLHTKECVALLACSFRRKIILEVCRRTNTIYLSRWAIQRGCILRQEQSKYKVWKCRSSWDACMPDSIRACVC